MFKKALSGGCQLRGVCSAPSRNKSTGSSFTMPPCDFIPPSYAGKDLAWMKDVRSKRLNPALMTYYRSPLFIHCGHMQWLFDEVGKRYLDLFGGIVTVSVGHCHPKVRAAAEEQMGKLWHTTNIYMHPKLQEYAYRLTEKMPEHLKVVYFVNSGSEANDLAMIMSRLYTRSNDILSLRNSYHGASPYTMGLTGQGNWKFNIASGGGVHHVNNPDTYQGLWGGHRDSPIPSPRECESTLTIDADGNEVCSSVEGYINQLKEVLMSSVAETKPAAFFAESIQGVGGTVQYPKGYLKKAFELIRSHGGICVSDEVQTGFGRTGDHFWGFESHDIQPDIVTMAKGIGNGFPLAAVVTTAEIAEVMKPALHFNTYGGNPISCAVGISVLEVMNEEKTQENSKEIGTYFLKELGKFSSSYSCVGDVRGKGLMIGVELVSDKKTRQPLDVDTIFNIWESCRNDGLLLGKGGRYGNVLRIKPPMCITKEDVDFSIKVIQKALETSSK